MIGIYKITNLINQHCYIGQSTQIQRRWNSHKNAAFRQQDETYNYPLYKAFRKYGLQNFSFQIIEECSRNQLNERQNYWINFYSPQYNQTIGGDYQTIYQKLTIQQVKEIQQILINDKQGIVSHKELAKKYNVHKDTIRDINVGRTWIDSNLMYPLHYSKYDAKKPNFLKKQYCIKCGKQLSKKNESKLCIECFRKQRKQNAIENSKITRQELKRLIRTESFTKIGKDFGVSDNAIKKWCDKFNLPRTKKEIKTYSDQEWDLI